MAGFSRTRYRYRRYNAAELEVAKPGMRKSPRYRAVSGKAMTGLELMLSKFMQRKQVNGPSDKIVETLAGCFRRDKKELMIVRRRANKSFRMCTGVVYFRKGGSSVLERKLN